MSKVPNLLNKNNDVSVLIVEDEIILAMGLELSLEKMGYKVSAMVCTCNDAVLHVQNNMPDIILMDINLNEKQSGIDAANIIWKRFKIPIIFLTSYSDDKSIKDAMESEPYAYLIKPCRDEELKASIHMSLHKHKFFFKNIKKDINKKETLIKLIDNLIYERSSNKLLKNNTEVKLTKNEKKLFYILCQYPGKIVSFQEISRYIYREEVYDLGKIRTLIYRIKLKLEINPFENIFEEGYKIILMDTLA